VVKRAGLKCKTFGFTFSSFRKKRRNPVA